MSTKLSWSDFKAYCDAKSLYIQEFDINGDYLLEAADGAVRVECALTESADITDYENNYQGESNKRVSTEKNYDGRDMIHSTPRYRGTVTCFTSIDDSQTDDTKIWGGSNKIKLDHQIGDSSTATIYMDFNTIINKTYIFTGLMQWSGCDFDEWSCSIVPTVTTISAGSNTNYTVYGGYLIIPAAGDGDTTVNAADMRLVQVTPNEYGVLPAGYWDADYNESTKQFENITANSGGTGEFNMFSTEVTFHHYVNDFVMIGDSSGAHLTSFDADQLGHNVRLRFDFTTVGTDHDWKFAGAITMFRKKTA